MALLERAVRRRRRLGLRDRQPLTPLWRLDVAREGAIGRFVRRCPCVVRDLRCECRRPSRTRRHRLWRQPRLWGAAQQGGLADRPARRLRVERVGCWSCIGGRKGPAWLPLIRQRCPRGLSRRAACLRCGMGWSSPFHHGRRVGPKIGLRQDCGRRRRGRGDRRGRRRRGGRLLARPLRPRVRDRGRLEPGLHLTDRRRRGRDLLDRRRSRRQKTGQEPFRPGHWDVRHGRARLARNPQQEAHALLLAAGAAPYWRAISAR